MVTRYWYQTVVVQSWEKYGAVSIVCRKKIKNAKKESHREARHHGITWWNWGADHHVASSSSSSHGTCHWRRPGDPWSVMFDKRSWKLMGKNRNKTKKDNCWRTLEFLLCPFRSRLQTLIFRLEWAFPRFTAHWLPLEQLCGHQSLPTTQWPSTEIVTSSWRDSASWKANLDANLPGFGYKFLGLVGVDVEQQNIQVFWWICNQFRLEGTILCWNQHFSWLRI